MGSSRCLASPTSDDSCSGEISWGCWSESQGYFEQPKKVLLNIISLLLVVINQTCIYALHDRIRHVCRPSSIQDASTNQLIWISEYSNPRYLGLSFFALTAVPLSRLSATLSLPNHIVSMFLWSDSIPGCCSIVCMLDIEPSSLCNFETFARSPMFAGVFLRSLSKGSA